jgi:hypothetical protein
LPRASTGKNRGMSSANVFRILSRIARKVAAVIGECWYAQRRLDALRTGPDLYADRPDAGPDTYAEFMFRTSGVLLHEPSAQRRARGALTPR